MSRAVQAVILLHTQERRGQWVPLAELVRMLALPAELVQQQADWLVNAGQLGYATRDGVPLYALGAEGVSP